MAEQTNQNMEQEGRIVALSAGLLLTSIALVVVIIVSVVMHAHNTNVIEEQDKQITDLTDQITDLKTELNVVTDEDLLKCPFCGSSNVHIEDDPDHWDKYYIRCGNCWAHGPKWGLDGYGFDAVDAVHNWNELSGRWE